LKRPPRHHIGPVNRNYSITLPSEKTSTVYRSNGVVESVTNSKPEHRAAQLTVNNPWRQQKPAKLTPTARTLNHWRRDVPIMTVTTRGPGGRYTVAIGPHNAPIDGEWSRRYLSPTYGTYDEQLRTEAVLEAMTKVKDQKWNAGVALAESAGVVQMASDFMSLITRTRKALRKGETAKAYRDFRKKTKYMSYPAWRQKYWKDVNHVRSVREAKHIPTGWLYYHFGIAPTLSDIADAAEAHSTAIADLLYSGALYVTGYAKQTTKTAETYMYGHLEYNMLRSVRVIIGVRPKNYLLAKASELGVTNPVEALWNRAPWSWAVDYFTSFGKWLSVLDTSLGWTWDEKWVESWRVVASSTWTPVSQGKVSFYPVEKGSIRHKNINRKVRGDLYGPMGSILPQFKRRGPSVQQYSTLFSAFASAMRIPIRP